MIYFRIFIEQFSCVVLRYIHNIYLDFTNPDTQNVYSIFLSLFQMFIMNIVVTEFRISTVTKYRMSSPKYQIINLKY